MEGGKPLRLARTDVDEFMSFSRLETMVPVEAAERLATGNF